MPGKLDFTIKPLTPLFTGGTEGKCDRLHETGLMGSFRWWFEVLIRGLGGTACDPSTHECGEDNFCHSCSIFGTTGLKRAFRLVLERLENKDGFGQLKIRVKDKYTVNAGNESKTLNHFGWYLQPGISDVLTGTFYFPLRPLPGLSDKGLKQVLLLTFNLATQWGGLGAGMSKGYGVCEFSSAAKLNPVVALESLKRFVDGNNCSAFGGPYPFLSEFFFTKFRFNPGDPKHFLTARIFFPQDPGRLSYYHSKGVIPISPLVRYYLRQLIRDMFPGNDVLRHRLMGEVKGQRLQKSLINVSHAYAVPENEGMYEFRIWGWIPQNLHREIKRKNVIEKLREWTAADGELWKQCSFSPDKDFEQWFDMQEGDIGQKIGELLATEGGENK